MKIKLCFLDLYHSFYIGVFTKKGCVYSRSFRLPIKLACLIYMLHRIKQYGFKEGIKKPWEKEI
jgi:hypothetical protein